MTSQALLQSYESIIPQVSDSSSSVSSLQFQGKARRIAIPRDVGFRRNFLDEPWNKMI